MAVIVAVMVGGFFPAVVMGFQEAEGSAKAGAKPAPGPLGIDWNPENWTVQDVMVQLEQHRLPVLAVATVLVFLFLWVADVLRPGGLAKNGRDVKPHPSMVWAFAGLMVLATAVFSGAILKDQAWLVGPDPASLRGQAALAMAVYGAGIIASVGLVYLFARSAPKAALIPGVLDVPIGLLCLVLAAPVVMLSAEVAVLVYQKAMDTVVEPIAHPQLQLILDNRNDPWVWGIIGAAVIGAPIVEETIYRVFFQSALLKVVGSPWVAIVGAAGIFTAMHAIGPSPLPPYALAPIAVLGLSLGLAYERTRRVGVPIVMHMGFNAANIYLALRTQA